MGTDPDAEPNHLICSIIATVNTKVINVDGRGDVQQENDAIVTRCDKPCLLQSSQQPMGMQRMMRSRVTQEEENGEVGVRTGWGLFFFRGEVLFIFIGMLSRIIRSSFLGVTTP
ncbi:hypothetical protein NPIL_478711 [Nephila pilipes]|uniref:Uncharacterized protein n=1 Tax=Nephila pilipes TaxID=299642 RepID=A0A8X6MSF4_NEPPI|nr:hypothetical protein NPIL_478711 [Nephila pilipes]